MKKAYKKLVRMNNGVAAAAPTRVWGKGCAGKGSKTTNGDIPVGNYYKEIKGKN